MFFIVTLVIDFIYTVFLYTACFIYAVFSILFYICRFLYTVLYMPFSLYCFIYTVFSILFYICRFLYTVLSIPFSLYRFLYTYLYWSLTGVPLQRSLGLRGGGSGGVGYLRLEPLPP